VLGAEAVAEARAVVEANWGPDYVAAAAPTTPKSRKAKASGQDKATPQAQEAHEAIRPTHFEIDGLAGDEWTALDRNIYRLIRLRALQSVMAPVRGEQLTIKFHTADDADGEFSWSATARRTTFQGWRAAGNTVQQEDAEPEIEVPAQWTALQSLKVGTTLTWNDLAAEPHTTKPPLRYNEATLVKALEEHGIGRPSTFASLLASIEEKAYVEKKNIEGSRVKVAKLAMTAADTEPTRTLTERLQGGERDRLVPTALGRQALGFALQHFGDLFSYDFTAAMEARLDAISQATQPWKQVLSDTWNLYKERYQTLNSSSSDSPSAKSRDFGSGLKAVLTRKGPMLLREVEGQKATFYKWPAGVEFTDLTAAQAIAASAPPLEAAYATTATGAPIYKRSGKFGPYATDGTLNVPFAADDTPDSIRAKFAAKAAVAATEKRVGPFTFRVGPHGPYMYKTDLKTKKFVSIPTSVDVDRLTIKVADDIYKRGLEAAASAPKGKWTKRGE
jgi:DNA topoisomerase-1